MFRVPSRRAPLSPWVLRALVLSGVYGVAQTVFVALRSFVPDLATLWSVLLLALVLAVGILWVGAEIVLDRRPPEWTWLFAALAAGPGAGLLTWILNAVLVDDTGVADLQPALVGRASFTALLILASVAVGSRLGWLSLRRHGEGRDDPALDADDEAVSRQAALDRAGRTESAGPARPSPALRAPREVTGPTVAGVRTPGRRVRPDATPESTKIAERDRLPEAPRLAGERRVSRVRAGSDPAEETSVPASPFGPGGGDREAPDAPDSLAPPVVAVLPSFERPVPPPPEDEAADDGDHPAGPDRPSAARRRFGLRRPRPGGC